MTGSSPADQGGDDATDEVLGQRPVVPELQRALAGPMTGQVTVERLVAARNGIPSGRRQREASLRRCFCSYSSQVPDRDLQRLVRRRLFELDLTPDGAARRSGGRVPRELIRGLLRGQRAPGIGDALAAALARALDVTEYRVRKAAGLPAGEPFVARTRPHLRVVPEEE